MRSVGQSGADGLFLGGLTDENGAQVIRDKVAVLGPNDGDVKLYMPDGSRSRRSTRPGPRTRAVPSSRSPGCRSRSSRPAGQEFIDEFATRVGDQPVDPYGVYGAQAAQIVLDAIAKSDYTRAGVIEQLFATEVTGGFLGDFSFNENGDPTLASEAVVGFTIFRGDEQLEVETSFSPRKRWSRPLAAADTGDGAGGDLGSPPRQLQSSQHPCERAAADRALDVEVRGREGPGPDETSHTGRPAPARRSASSAIRSSALSCPFRRRLSARRPSRRARGRRRRRALAPPPARPRRAFAPETSPRGGWASASG